MLKIVLFNCMIFLVGVTEQCNRMLHINIICNRHLQKFKNTHRFRQEKLNLAFIFNFNVFAVLKLKNVTNPPALLSHNTLRIAVKRQKAGLETGDLTFNRKHCAQVFCGAMQSDMDTAEVCGAHDCVGHYTLKMAGL